MGGNDDDDDDGYDTSFRSFQKTSSEDYYRPFRNFLGSFEVT